MKATCRPPVACCFVVLSLLCAGVAAGQGIGVDLPSGYSVTVPADWTHSTQGASTIFADPTGAFSLMLETAPNVEYCVNTLAVMRRDVFSTLADWQEGEPQSFGLEGIESTFIEGQGTGADGVVKYVVFAVYQAGDRVMLGVIAEEADDLPAFGETAALIMSSVRVTAGG